MKSLSRSLEHFFSKYVRTILPKIEFSQYRINSKEIAFIKKYGKKAVTSKKLSAFRRSLKPLLLSSLILQDSEYEVLSKNIAQKETRTAKFFINHMFAGAHWQIFDNKSCFDVRKYYCQETVVLRDP